MKLQIIAMGTKMPAWVKQGYAEYAKRFPNEFAPTLLELPLAVRSKNAIGEKIKEQEGKAILRYVGPGNHVVAMEVGGKPVSTERLVEKLADWQQWGQSVSLLIGGPDGLSAQCVARAQEKWSLSAMTLPHPLVRIILIEQLYRAWTILQNHPYHK